MYKGLLTAAILTLSFTAFSGTQTICGATDDRVLSFEPKIGRLAVQGQHRGCTVTMINDECGISAGHCLSVLDQAEFNTPVSADGQPQPSDKQDVYLVDKESIKYQDEGPGKDWAVFKLKPNAISGKLPGAVQGYYDVSFKKPKKGTDLIITGYGRDADDADRNFAQQTNNGKLETAGSFWRGASFMAHTVDTMGGNSGSSIIETTSQKIIGIHTHGGCRSDGGANLGTLISGHDELKAAIKACLNK